MELDAKGKKIVQCGIEFLSVKEELSKLSNGELDSVQQERLTRLRQRKLELLTEVGALSEGESRG
jgi:hypothetical protein